MTFESIGADIEVFAKNEVGHVALCGLIGGTKEKPRQIKTMPPGFCVQEDNVALEFNIPPAYEGKEFNNYIKVMLGQSKALIESLGFSLAQESSAIFPKDQLIHPNTQVFGCEPDYDAWKLRVNKKPKAKDPALRTAGGHVHIGTSGNIVDIARKLDLFLGIPSVYLDNSEESKQRRELYGKAGAIRPKPYGLEYRTLSNFWVFNDKAINFVYYGAYRATVSGIKITAKLGKEIQRIINTGDEDAARNIAGSFGLPQTL